MKDAKHYVLGFAFSPDLSRVLLILKNRPEWQKGKLNGVGGKVEKADLSPEHAMIREFREETGIQTYKDEWQQFATLTFPNDKLGGVAIVHCFRSATINLDDACNMTDEMILLCDPDTLFQDWETVKHLSVLIPMALDNTYLDCALTINN